MIVAELIETLQEMDQDADVRIAEIGYRSRFEYAIDDMGSPAEVVLGGGETVVYLAQGHQIGYLPEEATAELG